MPKNVFVLIDKEKIYRYFSNNVNDTYIRAIEMDTRVERDILNYKYLLDWVNSLPILRSYPVHLKNDIEILNYVRSKI